MDPIQSDPMQPGQPDKKLQTMQRQTGSEHLHLCLAGCFTRLLMLHVHAVDSR